VQKQVGRLTLPPQETQEQPAAIISELELDILLEQNPASETLKWEKQLAQLASRRDQCWSMAGNAALGFVAVLAGGRPVLGTQDPNALQVIFMTIFGVIAVASLAFGIGLYKKAVALSKQRTKPSQSFAKVRDRILSDFQRSRGAGQQASLFLLDGYLSQDGEDNRPRDPKD
jgi:hypothetical protein